MAFKIKVIAEAEAVENNSQIAREYGLSESMVQEEGAKQKFCSPVESMGRDPRGNDQKFLQHLRNFEPKPSAISRAPFPVKNQPNFCHNNEKIARLIGEEIW